MRRNLIYTFWVVVMAFYLSGCTAAVIGGAAAVGIYALTKDSVTTSADVSFQKAWKVANDQLRTLGEVDEAFQKFGEIFATVEGSEVHVKIIKLTEKTVDIHVSARKNLLPHMKLAQLVLASIIRAL